MFETHTNNKTKAPAERQPKRADAALGGKEAPKHNPVWQSLALRSSSVQPKLSVSQPDDPYEQEADHIGGGGSSNEPTGADSLRGAMGASFGFSFADVRLRTDAQAARTATNARAYRAG
jgi:hypothetical protein